MFIVLSTFETGCKNMPQMNEVGGLNSAGLFKKKYPAGVTINLINNKLLYALEISVWHVVYVSAKRTQK